MDETVFVELLKEGDLITVAASGARTSVDGYTPGVVRNPTVKRKRGEPAAFSWSIPGGSIDLTTLYLMEGRSWIRGHGSEAVQALAASRKLLSVTSTLWDEHAKRTR